MFFFFNNTSTPELYTLSLHDALPILILHQVDRFGEDDHLGEGGARVCRARRQLAARDYGGSQGGRHVQDARSEEHTSELQSHSDLVCRLLLEKKKRQTEVTHQANLPT